LVGAAPPNERVNGIPVGAAKPFQSRGCKAEIGRARREHDAPMCGGKISVLAGVKHGSVCSVFPVFHEMQHTPIKTRGKNNLKSAKTRLLGARQNSSSMKSQKTQRKPGGQPRTGNTNAPQVSPQRGCSCVTHVSAFPTQSLARQGCIPVAGCWRICRECSTFSARSRQLPRRLRRRRAKQTRNFQLPLVLTD